MKKIKNLKGTIVLTRGELKKISGGTVEQDPIDGGSSYRECYSHCFDGRSFNAPVSPPGGNRVTSPCRNHGGTITTNCS